MSQMIGVRQLHNNFSEIAKKVAQGEDFIVIRYSAPLFRIVPIDAACVPEKKYSLSDLKQFAIKTNNPTLSKNIDKIIYEEK